MRFLKTILLLLIITVSSPGCALYHHYGPYYGKIIDEETKKPIEGVVVLAVYHTWLHASPGGPASYFLDAQEAVTDKNGEFRLPTFNAIAFRPISTFSPLNPYITIFKPRYICNNHRLTEDRYETIELRELKTKEERIRNTDCYPVSVPDKKMEKFIEVNNIERIALGLEPGHLAEKKK